MPSSSMISPARQSVIALHERVLDHHRDLDPMGNPLPDVPPFLAAGQRVPAKHDAQNWSKAMGLYQVGLPWRSGPFSQF